MTKDAGEQARAVAQTAWGEARGCGERGMHAVINVQESRADHPSWWGDDLYSVCHEPYQFSCWNAGNPNLPKMLAVTTADPEYASALMMAGKAVHGTLPDITKGADSYYAKSMSRPPAWAARASPVYEDQWHKFFRLQNPAPDTVTKDLPAGDPAAPCYSIHAPAETAGEIEADKLDEEYNTKG
jgi:hypothetical protein